MHILITGGTGLIGTHLVPSLLAASHEVTVLTRAARPTQLAGLRFVAWDGKRIPDEVGNVDAVINLAGAGIADGRWTPEHKRLILESRIDATSACVRFIRGLTRAPEVFISGSAVGFYGTARTEPVDESSGPGHDFLSLTSRKWEAAAADAGIRTVIIRTGVVLANEGGAYPKLLAPFKVYAGGYIGDGKQGFPWIHITDVIGLIEFALATPTLSGPINLTAPELLTNAEFGSILGRVMGRPSGLPVPAFVIKALLGESAILVLEGQRVRPRVAEQAGYRFVYPKAELALKKLLSEQA
jgi:uncharacterized protein (TIGR01777 family)